MNNLKTNINLPLLYEVRKDAMKQAKDGMPGDDLFPLIHHMLDLSLTARKEGLLALNDAALALPSDVRFYSDIKEAVDCMCDGMDAEDLIEFLTSRYWSKHLQGENALFYFLIILAMVRIQDDAPPPCLLERLLTACLSEKERIRYFAYSSQRKKEKKSEPEAALEHLLRHESNIGEGGILVVRALLEEKIQCASEPQLKKVIRTARETDLIMSLKGLSVLSKKKLLSAMPEQSAREYALDCKSMGPVRQIDVMASFAELISIFEKQ